MADWPDRKIRATALWYIEKHVMEPTSWRWTMLGESHPEVSARVELQPGELPVVSYFRSAASWYLFTTRRIIGSYSGQEVEVFPLDVLEDRFGNFKGYGGQETEVMTLRLSDGSEVGLEYETTLASMAPIYYMQYWKIKFPVLDKLRDDPGAADRDCQTNR